MYNWVTTWACAHRATCFTTWNQDGFSYTIDNNLYGNAIRLNYSNWYGEEDVEIIDASVEMNNKIYHFFHNGERNLVVKGGEFNNRYSDPVMIKVTPGKIKVSILFADKRRPGSGQTFITPPGISMILQAIEVLTDKNVRVVAALGDSITHCGNWIVPLKNELYNECEGEIALFEMAINGSRLLNDSPICLKHTWGYNAKLRLKHDILQLAGVTDCIISLGLNDLGIREEEGDVPFSLENYKQTFCECIDQLQNNKIRVIGLTILPRDYKHTEEEDNYTIEKNEYRKEMNRWILEEAPFDIAIDASENIRNKDDSRMLPQYSCEDGIHLNEKGGIVVKNTIKTKL